MNKTLGKNFVRILSVAIATCSLSFVTNIANAATRSAVRGTPVSRKPVTNTQPVTTQTATTQNETVTDQDEIIAEPEPEFFENKSSQFGDVLSETISVDSDMTTSDLAEQIRKQRAAADARDNIDVAQTNLQNSLRSGKNTCDSGLRQCMKKNCGDDFTKCATDGDTIFGDKLNKCRRETTCTGEEFNLFTAEIKSDRDMNVRLASYNAIINCGNNYNACIQKECGDTFTKCLGKPAADAAVKKCATIAKNCTQQDSGLAARFGKVIGELRGVAEKDIKTDEARLYELRKLMRPVCEKLGAMFDERSFDCVYTVNFFAGQNQTTPMASRKLYAGDTFFCNQEWFGTNVTTYKENAYRETRAQTAASSAMLGSGLGTAAGLISSGAIGRALETQQAKKELENSGTQDRATATEANNEGTRGNNTETPNTGTDGAPAADGNKKKDEILIKTPEYNKDGTIKSDFLIRKLDKITNGGKFKTGDLPTGNPTTELGMNLTINSANNTFKNIDKKFGINKSSGGSGTNSGGGLIDSGELTGDLPTGNSLTSFGAEFTKHSVDNTLENISKKINIGGLGAKSDGGLNGILEKNKK